jgi:hypothetical protein
VSNAGKAFVLFLFAAAVPAAALSFTVSGGWSLTLDGADLSGTAGSDLVSSHASASNAVVIDIADAVDQFEVWYIDIHKVEGTWDASLILSAIRTTDGTGLGTISGGTALREITDTETRFFEGTGNRGAIHIQLTLDGISVILGSITHSLQIVYTLLENP